MGCGQSAAVGAILLLAKIVGARVKDKGKSKNDNVTLADGVTANYADAQGAEAVHWRSGMWREETRLSNLMRKKYWKKKK